MFNTIFLLQRSDKSNQSRGYPKQLNTEIQFSATLLLKTLPHPVKQLLKKTFSNILGWITQWRVASQANLHARRMWSFEVRCHERAKVRVILRSNKRCSRCRDGERLVTECVLLPRKATSVDELCYSCFQKPPVAAPSGRTTLIPAVEPVNFQSYCPKLLTLDLEDPPLSAPRLGSLGEEDNNTRPQGQ